MKLTSILFLVVFCNSCATRSGGDNKAEPADSSSALPRKVYEVTFAASPGIVLDGRLDEPAWQAARADSSFTFPWKKDPAPLTEFRAVYDKTHFYFCFRVQDSDLVLLDQLRDEEDEVFEDRVEVYFSRDDKLTKYFCFEIDGKGRVFDYRGSFYRQLDPKWKFEGLEAGGLVRKDGYNVEGRIPLEAFPALGLPDSRAGKLILCGLYRAEFSHDRSGKPVKQQDSIHNLGRRVEGPPPIENWISWVDPRVKEPDFHIPATFGWLKFDPAGN